MLIHEFISLHKDSVTEHISYKAISQTNHVAIPDEVVLSNSQIFLTGFHTYWDSLDSPNEGLNYHGVTIISTCELPRFVCTLKRLKAECGINDLILLCNSAIASKMYIVHFGI